MKDKTMFEDAFGAIGNEAVDMLEREKDAIKGKISESTIQSATITLSICVDLSGKSHSVSTKFKVVADSLPIVSKSVVVGEDPDQLGLAIPGSVTVRNATVVPPDGEEELAPTDSEGTQVLFPNPAKPVTATETPALAKKRGRKSKEQSVSATPPAPVTKANPFDDDDEPPVDAA